jgi:hypothetical protein
MTPEDLITKPKPIAKKRGRPSKQEISNKTRGNRSVMGRPKGDASVINEYKARMLASPKSNKVLESIFDAALDNDHKNQAAAWKLIMDRMLPISYFEKDKAGGGRNSVSISITGVGGETTVVGGNTIEGEIEDA